MGYGIQDCLRDLMGLRDSTASGDDETALNFFLLSVIRDKGARGVADLIESLDKAQLGQVQTTQDGPQVTMIITRPGFKPLIVTAGDDDLTPWVMVRVEADASSHIPEDPRHAAFYAIWDKFVSGETEFSENCSDQEKLVYMIATLDFQVMNGGFGQYLANTDGLYLAATFDCLQRIGATKTHAFLTAAVELASGFDSYDAAWDEASEKYTLLDDEFYDAAEDLAGLAADALLI